MPTTNENGIITPSGTDAFRPTADQRTMARSIRHIVYVANTTERSAVVAAMTAAGNAPSITNPVYVHRGDAAGGRELEFSPDGTNWRTVPSRIDVAGASAAIQRQVFMKTGNVSTGGTNASGDGQIIFPDPFPNGLLVATLTESSLPSNYGAVILKWTASTSNATRITFRAYQAGGTALANAGAGLGAAYVAIGY